MSILFKPTQGGAMFNNVDQVNVVTNTNGESVTIDAGYYTLSEIIAILNTMSNTTFSISTMATSYGSIWIQSAYSIDFTNAPEVQNILGFESSVLEKGLDNPKRCYLSTTCNQIVVTNGSASHVLSIPTGYYTFTEFIESVSVELNKHVSTPSITLVDEYAQFNTIDEEWYFDR